MKFLFALVVLTTIVTTHSYDANHVQRIIKGIFGVSYVDVEDIVDKIDNQTYSFNDVITQFIDERVIPELCEMTSKKIDLYNSYLLDKHLLEELEHLGPQCREFKCNLAHYVKDNGARIFYTLFHEESTLGSLGEGAEYLSAEISALFEKLEMCTCGKKFIKAVINSSPYYFSNAFFDLNDNEAIRLSRVQIALRNLDTDALRRTASRLLDHLCAKTNSGMCINSIAKVAGRVGNFWENTFVYDIHNFWETMEGGDEEGGIEIMKKCDTFWYVFQNVESEYSGSVAETFYNLGRYTNAFFCDEYCQEKRGTFYPCCMQKMLNDKKMWDNLHKAIESYYRVWEALYFIWDRGYVPSFWTPPEYYPDEDWENYIKKNGKMIRKVFLRFIDGAKYCKSGRVECSDDF